MKAIHIPVASPPVLVEIDGKLDSLQKLVGGYIEPVTLDREDGTTLYCNEDGKTMGLPVNETATQLTRGIVQYFDIIVGDTVVIGFDETTGDSADVPQKWIDELVGR